MSSEFNRFELCTKELDFLQSLIAKYDSNGLTIKSWCVTAVSALWAYSVVHHSSFVALIPAATTVGFGILELVFRCIQYRFIKRSKVIEAMLQAETLSEYRYGLSTVATNYHWGREFRAALKEPQATVLYLISLGVNVLLILGLKYDWIPKL